MSARPLAESHSSAVAPEAVLETNNACLECVYVCVCVFDAFVSAAVTRQPAVGLHPNGTIVERRVRG